MKLIRKFAFTSALVAILSSSPLLAEEKAEREKVEFPESDIFLFDLDLNSKTAKLANGKNVTARAGYENQPSFTKDSASFLFSQSDDYQTDVYEYFIGTGETKRITDTPENEFSPIASPGNQSISFVTETNRSVGHISRADPKNLKWAFEKSGVDEPVGYYSWNHETGYVLFWSRYGFNITLSHQSKAVAHYVTGNAVPSSPQIIPGTNKFSFVHRQGNESVWIKEFDPERKSIRPIAPVIGSNSNYGWAPDGSILMIQDNVLSRWTSNGEAGWTKIADLSDLGIDGAARLAVSPDSSKIAIVGKPAAK